MLDGITESAVAAAVAATGATLVAGYVNGRWPDLAALVKGIPGCTAVSITVNAQGSAVVLDVENGDATPQEAPGWAKRMRAAGIRYPVVYMNASTWQAVKDEFAAQAIDPPLYWLALYDGVAEVPAGAIAKQHTSTPGYDVSAVADYWPGVDPVPEPVADAGQILEETFMQIEPLSVHPGEYAAVVPVGTKSLAIVADGYSEPGASLRVVLWDSKGDPTVLSNVAVGGTAPHHVVGIELGAAVGMTVRRLDSETYPIALGFRS